MTHEDTLLLECLPHEVARLKANILQGRPYVWELRLSLQAFYALESAIQKSISSHGGDYHHLLSEDFSVLVVMYLAEWYKRFYKGADTMDENKVLALNTEELKALYKAAKIDSKVFVYNASKNPDKTSFRWLESLQVLGGLAVQAELKREQTDALLPQLCKIFHGEEIDLENLKDRNRAVAFQESIARQHSLYEYLDCILDPAKEPPFAVSDMKDRSTQIPEFIHRIQSADALAKRDKFDFEWLITYTAARQIMVRHLRVKLKPEVIGGGRKQYIGYDRLRSAEWGIEHPEEIGRIRFYLRFKNGPYTVQKEGEREEPLFKYDNTGSEVTGFLSVNKEDENTYTNIPVNRFDRVEIVMQYEDATGHAVTHKVQELPVKDYLQVYALPKASNRYSSRRNSQAATVVIFSSAYHLAAPYQELPVAYAHYRNGEACSEDYCWCPINDMVVLVDGNGKEVQPPFFNRNGLYQVVTKKYLKTIKYKDNIFVLYQYVDADYDETTVQEDNLPVLFGRSGLEVRHYPNGQTKEGNLVADYDLEWQKNGRYVDWKEEEPPQGAIRLRVTVKGLVFVLRVYYVPFEPANEDIPPIWRDFEHQRICTRLEGVADIQDHFDLHSMVKEPDTKQLEIGTPEAKVLIDVYRPVILRELSQRTPGSEESKVVEYHSRDENVRIPLINCDQFTVRDFSEEGVHEYQVKSRSTVYYSFPTFNQLGLDYKKAYALEESASQLTPEIPLDYLKIYITGLFDKASHLYAWDYKDEPKPVAQAKDFTEAGIVFQSLKEEEAPRHYVCPTIRTNASDDWGDDDDDDWGDEEEKTQMSVLQCFLTAAAHKTYFFLFSPLVECVSKRRQIQEILFPLLQERRYQLTEEDVEQLYKFAVHFHFDWMLLPRDLWNQAIASATEDEAEQQQIRTAVETFFCRTPKCTDEREQLCLQRFVKKYWTFDAYPKIDEVAERALRLIKNDPDALNKVGMLKEFLKQYDECRFKFIEMDKAIVKVNE
jgi:hypothetical protein